VDNQEKNQNVWLLAARPKTLPAAVAPVIIGMALACADNSFHLLSALAVMTAAILIQIGTNYANDYADYKSGVDQGERLGPLRVTQAGLVTPQAMKRATALIFILALLIGIYLVFRGGWPILVIGILSILFGVLYTSGPYPLGYNGLGEIFVLIFFGPVAVAGTYYVQSLNLTTASVIAGLAPGLFSVAILDINNLRDIPSDTESGKRTLQVRFGLLFSRCLYAAAMIVACFVPFALFTVDRSHPYSLAASVVVLISLPTIISVLKRRQGRPLNDTLAATGKLLLLYSLFFSIGWLL
jgi:1,4-dihydroxy-2-naphthoate octaprenyltransferase